MKPELSQVILAFYTCVFLIDSAENVNEMITLPNVVLTGATLTTALVAGLLYGYYCSVNPGLNRLSDVQYVLAMQSINRAIQNPVFFICFLGAPLLLPICTWQQYSQPATLRFWLLLAATGIYLIGVFGVTVLGNVPLNNAIESFSVQSASLDEIARQRSQFEIPWNRWHTIRTVASVLSLLLLIIACLNQTVAVKQ